MRSSLASLLLLVAAWPLHAQPSADRGQLLYETHCVSCHSSEMHWRDQRLARDWDSLKAQVRRWQEAAGLQWSEDDIRAVAAHLNATVYHFPQPQARK